MNRDWSRAVAVIVVAGVVRLAIAALTPLFPDETYYWEWSRRLAPAYFDHPPMIAWLIRGGTALAGHTPLGVRLLPVIAGTLGAFFVAAAARRLAGERAALVAAIIFAVMPLSAAGLVLATPDAPLIAAVAAAICALLRAVETPTRSRASLLWWSVTGVGLGLGLTSKYTATLLPFGVLVAFASLRGLRDRLREPGPYVAIVIALLVFSPVIVWNARHEWISFAFQLQHGLGGTAGAAFKRELELVGGQVALVSPVLFVLCVIAIVNALRAGAAARPAEQLLAVVAIAMFSVFVYSATRRRVEANWPAIVYVPAVLLLAAMATRAQAVHAVGLRLRDVAWWTRIGVVVACVLTGVTYVNAFTPILPVPARRDPAARAAGWEELARAVHRVASQARTDGRPAAVAADRYQDASELAFHLPGHPPTFALNLTSRANQYDLWPSFASSARPGDALLVVTNDTEGTHPTVAMLEAHFARVQRHDVVQLAREGNVVRALRIWMLEQWRGTWPEAQLRSRP